MDPNAKCPPSLNFDISGLGVRISFYLQALFLGPFKFGDGLIGVKD